jgi:hypothetical protein
MATGTFTTSTTISDITGYCCIAETRYGSNGGNEGTPEWDVGSASNQTTGRTKWADDPDDGFDTGLLNTELGTSQGGAEGIGFALQDSPDSPLIYVGVTYGSIGNVLVRAGAQITSTVSWTGVNVTYYKNGNQTETYEYNGTFQVSTTDGSPTAEVILTVVPQFDDNDQVTVQGSIEMVLPAGYYPGPDDMFNQVFVYTASCSSGGGSMLASKLKTKRVGVKGTPPTM